MRQFNLTKGFKMENTKTSGFPVKLPTLFMFEADESREFLTGVYSLVKKDMETQDMDAARWHCLDSATMYGKGFLRDLCKFVAETDDPATANDFIIKILDLTT
jgi:hypothetical protein